MWGILSVLMAINSFFDLRRNVRESSEAKRRRAFEVAGRDKIRRVARKLERLGGRRAKVRAGLDDEGDFALVVERWPDEDDPPDTYMGYPVHLPVSMLEG